MRCGSRISPTSRPGPALSMSPSSLTPMRGALSAGGPHEPRMRASYSMRSSRPSMTGNRRIAAGSCITATEAANTSRSSIPSASRKQASSRRSAASAIVTTMPSRKRSMASTRPRSSIGADHGGPWKPSNSQRSDGSTGSTIAGCWSLSATSRRSKPRNATTPGWQKPPWRRDSNKIASGNPGAVHAEFGLVAATGREGLAQLAAIITDESNREALPFAMKQALQTIIDQLAALELQIGTLDRAIHAHHRDNDMSSRLETVPGIGVIGATAIASTVTDARDFKTGRDFSAWIGLVPRQHSTGGKERLGGISKQGDRYLRRLLVIGATAVVRQARQHPQKRPWIMRLLAKKPAKLVAVAVANKMARIAWAILAKGGYYRAPELAAA